jgi:transposase-like protein
MKNQAKSQQGQQVQNFTEGEARAYFERLRWPRGPACVHCGSVNACRLRGESTRAGLLECRDCRQQFTVTVNSVMEDTHLPLATWARAFHFMCARKKGVSALQLQRTLGLGSYRTAWFLAHRIREAMKCEPVAGMLAGTVQVDETYVGASRHGKRRRAGDPKRKRGRGTTKTPVVVLVETDGNAHSKPVEHVDAHTLKSAMRDVIHPDACIVTDELRSYPPAAKGSAVGHFTVNHSADEYVNADGLHTNTAESYFALLKRGPHGSFHHVSKKHLHRYCAEVSFRWNGRRNSDTERRDLAVRGADGRRLMYRQPENPPKAPPAPVEQSPPFPA